MGLVAAGLARDDSKTTLPVPGSSVTSKLAQMLPSVVSETLTINEVRGGAGEDNHMQYECSLYSADWVVLVSRYCACE